MNILIIDNYDSFTYNLVQLISNITGAAPDVVRNDRVVMKDLGNYDKIILSPGPGKPSAAGSLLQVITACAASKSILGVCLGHQAIGQVFGAGPDDNGRGISWRCNTHTYYRPLCRI